MFQIFFHFETRPVRRLGIQLVARPLSKFSPKNTQAGIDVGSLAGFPLVGFSLYWTLIDPPPPLVGFGVRWGIEVDFAEKFFQAGIFVRPYAGKDGIRLFKPVSARFGELSACDGGMRPCRHASRQGGLGVPSLRYRQQPRSAGSMSRP
jgi:hypothetical protein